MDKITPELIISSYKPFFDCHLFYVSPTIIAKIISIFVVKNRHYCAFILKLCIKWCRIGFDFIPQTPFHLPWTCIWGAIFIIFYWFNFSIPCIQLLPQLYNCLEFLKHESQKHVIAISIKIQKLLLACAVQPNFSLTLVALNFPINIFRTKLVTIWLLTI